MVTSSKKSIVLKIKDLVALVTKEVYKLYKFSLGIQKNVDVILGYTRTLIKDIHAFNKDFAVELKLKKESYSTIFKIIGNSLTYSCFKTQLAPILDIVLRLPANAIRPSMLMSQGEDKGGSLKDGGGDKGKVVGKVF
ncbi:unnamed protein product [Lactuca saligna]|uniref:Uncharacterized protein n=1 Tax=Lactuca saligna TaxID=75948 RepID=A0AA35ZKB4_LACSI|nr:unnamed protein product [Lactuca saligna]